MNTEAKLFQGHFIMLSIVVFVLSVYCLFLCSFVTSLSQVRGGQGWAFQCTCECDTCLTLPYTLCDCPKQKTSSPVDVVVFMFVLLVLHCILNMLIVITFEYQHIIFLGPLQLALKCEYLSIIERLREICRCLYIIHFGWLTLRQSCHYSFSYIWLMLCRPLFKINSLHNGFKLSIVKGHKVTWRCNSLFFYGCVIYLLYLK